MKVATAFSVVGLALLGKAAAFTPGSCDSAFSCSFQYQQNGHHYKWDMRPLCGDDDRVHNNAAKGHTYNFKICGVANKGCFPSWKNYANYGVAIQSWGAKIQGKTCYDKDGNEHDCTEACEVIGKNQVFDQPIGWEPIVEGGKVTGAKHLFQSVRDGQDDPNWCGAAPGRAPPPLRAHTVPSAAPRCDIDPKTGEQYRRQVVYHFTCDKSVDDLKVVNVTQDPNNDCYYTMFFRTKRACPTIVAATPAGGISGGSVFLIILFVGAALYVAAGVGYAKLYHNEWTHPHIPLWRNFIGLVRDGFVYTTSFFTGKGYHDIERVSQPVPGGDAEPAGATGTYQSGSESNTYTDL